jgi:hypothetical protein
MRRDFLVTDAMLFVIFLFPCFLRFDRRWKVCCERIADIISTAGERYRYKPVLSTPGRASDANLSAGLCKDSICLHDQVLFICVNTHPGICVYFGFEALVRCNATEKVLARLTCERIEQLKTKCVYQNK